MSPTPARLGVAVVSPAAAGARIAQYSAQLAEALCGRFDAWHLLVVEPKASETSHAAPEAVAALTLAGPAPLALGVPAAISTLRRRQPDVVLLQLTPAAPAWFYPVVALGAGRSGRRVVVQVHVSDTDESAGAAPGGVERLVPKALRSGPAPAVVVGSTDLDRRWAARRFGLDPRTVVRIADLAATRERPVGGEHRLVAFIADGEDQVRSDLIRAFDGISESVIDRYRLVLVTRGDGLDAARELVAGCHHGSRIELCTDKLDDAALRALVESADAAIIPDPPHSSRALQVVMSVGAPVVVPSEERQVGVAGRYPGTVAAALRNAPELLVGIEQAVARRAARHPEPGQWRQALDTLGDLIADVAVRVAA